MSTPDVIADALKLPSGARFVRCALQVNPHHYSGTFRGERHDGSAADYADAMVRKARDLDVRVLAVTDHNSVSDIAAFRDAAQGTNVTILPGFELESTEGIHILCIYSPDTSESILERFLGEFGVRDTEPSSSQCNDSFESILSKVKEQEGVTIAAHSTGDKGLFKALHGRARVRAWRCGDLLAVQIPGSIDDLGDDIREIIRNKNHDYRREHPAGERQAVAVLNAKDVAKPDGLDHASATCLIKMSEEPSSDALRQAFLDPDSRVRLNSFDEPEGHSEIVALTWEGGGFLDGAAVHFNQNLNVLIGGRGTGKSTVIESLRYVLGLDPIGDDARKIHGEIVRHVIKHGTRLSLLVRSYHPAEHEYTIERTAPNPPVVRDQNGDVLHLLPKDILPRMEVYGQHEISELTSSADKLTLLLQRFVKTDESLSRRKAEVQEDLEKTRQAILQARSERDDIQERLAELPRLKQTLERFQEAGIEERLRDQSLLVREERILQAVPERTRILREAVETIRQELPLDTAFLSETALADMPGGSVLTGARPVLEQLSRELDDLAQQMEAALDRAEKEFGAIQDRWSERKSEVDDAYEKILRQLQKSAVDGEEFMRLRRAIERLQPLSKRQELLQRLLEEHSQRRRQLLAEWEDLKAREFRGLDRAASRVSRQLVGRVQVDVSSAGNRQPLFDLLREQIGDRLAETFDRLREADHISLQELVGACRKGADSLQQQYGLTSIQAGRLADASESTLMQIEELELPPTTDLKLNTASMGAEPKWSALKQLSKGQKATAVLLLLLLESDAPLVIDQPEDDLDNRFITDSVVPRIREEKRHRQFVFSTHNANIPVLGDAELILGLDASGEASEGRAFIVPEHIGSIDSPSVRILVEEILEGGKNAFEIRRRKYGF